MLFFLLILFCVLNYTGDATNVAGTERLNKLAAFQKKALEHVLFCKYLIFYVDISVCCSSCISTLQCSHI